jgi:pimeloyl-ACP methyl ester carboxylesterase
VTSRTVSPSARPPRPVRSARPPVVSGVLVLALLTGCTTGGESDDASGGSGGSAGGPSAEGLAGYYEQELDWESCQPDGFQCADLRVPLDYDDPDGEEISIAVTRRRADDRQDRVGSLVLNPGGPGGSGVDYAQNADSVVNAPLRERFDVVGFDPRGVGRSSPVECLDDDALDDFVATDGTPDSTEERQALVQESEDFAEGCEEKSGDLLPHVSTRDAARDMDVLRAALGDRRLTYLGKSYGTLLGATYAELFPKRVRALVLDGAIDPALPSDEVTRAQAEGFDRALRAFVADCRTKADCPLTGGTDEGVEQVRDLLARTDENPLPGGAQSDGREVTQSLAVLGIAAALYDQGNGWPVLRQGLARAQDGDGGVLLFLADFYLDRAPDGSYRNNQNEVIYAVNCLDRPEGKQVEEYAADAKSFADAAPVFGPYLAWSSLPCASWPEAPVDRPHEIRAQGADPILVVGTRRDPATPYEWAESLANQLDAGVLLTYEGDGHTAYARGDSCVDEKVEHYLITGDPPAAGTVCG